MLDEPFTGSQKAVNVVFGALLAISFLAVGLLVPVWTKRRSIQPIRSRPFVITISTNIGVALYCILMSFAQILHYMPCAVVYLVDLPVLLAVANLYLMRSWILWFAYNINQEKLKFDMNSIDSLWYFRNCKYISHRFLSVCFFGVNAVEIFIILAFTAEQPNMFRETAEVCPSAERISYFFAVLVILYAVLCIFISTKFRCVEDAFYIKREIRDAGSVCLIGGAIWMVVQFFEFNKRVFPLDILVLCVACLLLLACSLWFPIYKSYHMKTRKHQLLGKSDSGLSYISEQGPEVALAEVLASEQGRERFKDHLMKEFSVENLLFWQACEEFKRTFQTMDDPFARAQSMYKKFLEDGSPLQVNIHHKQSRELKEEIGSEKITAETFDEAASSIYKLMATDSYLRFEIAKIDALQKQMPCGDIVTSV